MYPPQHFSWLGARCLDDEACDARREKRYDASSRRSGTFRWCQSRFESPNIERGKHDCRWCGEPIILAEGVSRRYAARQRHYGDEFEVGDRNCRAEYQRTYAYNGRDLVQKRGDPCCVDCGEAEVWVVNDAYDEGGYWLEGDWEADHDIALEDGGPHEQTNIVRRCCECHRRKTARENAARRARRADQVRAAP